MVSSMGAASINGYQGAGLSPSTGGSKWRGLGDDLLQQFERDQASRLAISHHDRDER